MVDYFVMTTYREVVYMVLDELKLQSDDTNYTTDHIVFLANKTRALLLPTMIKSGLLQISEALMQELCLDMIPTDKLPGSPCMGKMLVSTESIPLIMPLGDLNIITKLYHPDYPFIEFTFIDFSRAKHVGRNKYLETINYVTILPDLRLAVISNNPQTLYLKNLRIKAIFNDPTAALELSCDKDDVCDSLDMSFPGDDILVAAVVKQLVQDLSSVAYLPKDVINNSTDDTSRSGSQTEVNEAVQPN